MPIYEYKCEKGHVTELVQSLKDKPLKSCPHCGKEVKKVPSRFSTDRSRVQG